VSDAPTPPLLPPGLVLRGEHAVLRPSREDDVEALVAVLAQPGVVRWWQDTSAADVREELGVGVTILVDDEIAGWLLVHEETEPAYRAVAFDIALADAVQGRGVGRDVLRTIVRHCVACGHHHFTIDPSVDNDAAIACYRAVGFRPVGILREQERWPDGVWRDALLMDLLARELT
jgi:aminoglycoside 6'-N-acetyltransferase